MPSTKIEITTSNTSNTSNDNNCDVEKSLLPYKVDDEVQVEARTWAGICDYGGPARVKNCYRDETGETFVDVWYIQGHSKKHIEIEYVKPLVYLSRTRRTPKPRVLMNLTGNEGPTRKTTAIKKNIKKTTTTTLTPKKRKINTNSSDAVVVVGTTKLSSPKKQKTKIDTISSKKQRTKVNNRKSVDTVDYTELSDDNDDYNLVKKKEQQKQFKAHNETKTKTSNKKVQQYVVLHENYEIFTDPALHPHSSISETNNNKKSTTNKSCYSKLLPSKKKSIYIQKNNNPDEEQQKQPPPTPNSCHYCNDNTKNQPASVFENVYSSSSSSKFCDQCRPKSIKKLILPPLSPADIQEKRKGSTTNQELMTRGVTSLGGKMNLTQMKLGNHGNITSSSTSIKSKKKKTKPLNQLKKKGKEHSKPKDTSTVTTPKRFSFLPRTSLLSKKTTTSESKTNTVEVKKNPNSKKKNECARAIVFHDKHHDPSEQKTTSTTITKPVNDETSITDVTEKASTTDHNAAGPKNDIPKAIVVHEEQQINTEQEREFRKGLWNVLTYKPDNYMTIQLIKDYFQQKELRIEETILSDTIIDKILLNLEEENKIFLEDSVIYLI